jgi:hypothetical protein
MWINNSKFAKRKLSCVGHSGVEVYPAKEGRGVVFLFWDMIRWLVLYVLKATVRESLQVESMGMARDVILNEGGCDEPRCEVELNWYNYKLPYTQWKFRW